jgi:hydrogenase-4 membrane subunit HyfE
MIGLSLELPGWCMLETGLAAVAAVVPALVPSVVSLTALLNLVALVSLFDLPGVVAVGGKP